MQYLHIIIDFDSNLTISTSYRDVNLQKSRFLVRYQCAVELLSLNILHCFNRISECSISGAPMFHIGPNIRSFCSPSIGALEHCAIRDCHEENGSLYHSRICVIEIPLTCHRDNLLKFCPRKGTPRYLLRYRICGTRKLTLSMSLYKLYTATFTKLLLYRFN